MIAISIRQPWASLILKCGKDIENRSWPTKFRGRILVHAAALAVPDQGGLVEVGAHGTAISGS